MHLTEILRKGPVVLLLGAVATSVGTRPAGAQPAGSLTLQAAIDRAMSANPALVAARLRRAVDAAGVSLARERLNPEATVEFEKEAPKEAYGVAVPLELGGKRGKRIAVSEAVVRAGEAELAATLAQVRNDVRRAYYGVFVADARLALIQEARDLARRVRDTAQQRFDAGSAARLEVMQTELALVSAENEAIAADGAAVAARATLNALLGQPLESPVALSTSIEGSAPVAANAVLTLARTTSTELAVLDRQIETQRARLTLAAALRVPDVTPTASFTRDAQPEFDYGWRAGVAVTVPLFTTHRAGVLVEQATLDQLLAQRQAALVRIEGQVTAAAVTAEAQRQLYLRYRDQIVPQAQQVEQVAQDAYQLGQTGIVPLLQALQSTREVRLRALDAGSGFQTALADLERAVGAPLP
jgi:cobalt-zinc-cadmium efflux system outer membrane protein